MPDDSKHGFDAQAAYQSIKIEDAIRALSADVTKAYGDICEQYDIERSITFDMAHKQMVLNFPSNQERFPIGTLLISFLETDFSEFDKMRKQTASVYHDDAQDFSVIGYPTQLPSLYESTIRGWGITPEQYARRVVIDKLIKLNIDLHPYLTFYMTRKVMTDDAEVLLNKKLEFPEIQKKVGEMFRFCLDIDFDDRLKSLSALQRYFIYRNTHVDRLTPEFNSEILLYPYMVPEKDRYIFMTQRAYTLDELQGAKDIHDVLIPNPLDDKMVEYTTNLDLTMTEAYRAYDAQTVATLELFKMIQHNMFVKKCEYCSRYFVLKGDYGNRYCDRIPAGKKQTCQQLGASRDYNAKVKRSPARKEYMRAYKRMHSRINYGMISEEKFNEWKYAANDKLRLCEEGAVTLDAFKSWLGNK